MAVPPPPVTTIAFANSRSGSGDGSEVLKALSARLGAEKVFDLGTFPHPEEVLTREDLVYAARGLLRVIVCGGDGTMTWIMAAVDVAQEKLGGLSNYNVAIAPVPLGTGNDLARSFGWGGHLKRNYFKKPLEFDASTPAPLDRWLCCVMPNSVDADTIPEVFTVHEFDAKPLTITHRIVTRGLHFSRATTGESRAIIDDARQRSEDDQEPSFERDFLKVDDDDDTLSAEKLAEKDEKESTGMKKSKSASGFSEEDEFEVASRFSDRGGAMIESHVAPSESVLKTGGRWRSFDGTFSNYFSLGLDAAAAFAFHAARREDPARFTSRTKNQLLYAWLGLLKTGGCLGCGQPPPLLDSVAELLVKNNGTWKQIKFPRDSRGLIVLNLQSYAGGRDLWGTQKSPDFQTPDVADGLLEIVTATNIFNLATKLITTKGLGGHTHRLAQANELRIRLKESTYMQIDGEPWHQSPATVHIKAIGRSTVLRHVESTTKKPSCCSCR